MPSALVTENLGKRYPVSDKEKGHSIGSGGWSDNITATIKAMVGKREYKNALSQVNLTVEQGEFFGLLGVNGAGKTTLIKLLCCLLYPDEGNATVYGFDIRRQRRQVKSATTLAKGAAFIGVHWALTVRQNLEHYAKICGLSAALAGSRADQALEALDLMDKQHDLVWHLSAGQRQKVTLAMAFLVRTPMVFLDEPTVHLDPNVASEVRHFIRETLNRQLGQTVLMSTHYVREAEMLCDRVGILHNGSMLATGTVSQLVNGNSGENLWEARILNHQPELEERLRSSGRYKQVLVSIEDPNQGRAAIRLALSNHSDALPAIRTDLDFPGIHIMHIKKAVPSLEDVYVGMVQKEGQSA